jgi:hypothetical protein
MLAVVVPVAVPDGRVGATQDGVTSNAKSSKPIPLGALVGQLLFNPK